MIAGLSNDKSVFRPYYKLNIGRVIEKVADLTFGEYLRLCQNPETWKKLFLAIERKIFCDFLEKIREIRNNIMHFDHDGLELENIETLRNFVRLLQTLRT